MENSINIRITKYPENTSLNTFNKSFQEGIYSFNISDSRIEYNFPVANVTGFLSVNTDFDDKYCIQKITTLNKQFFFRTGRLENDVFVWDEWDQYASVADIPARSLNELNDEYVLKDSYYPKPVQWTGNKTNNFAFDTFHRNEDKIKDMVKGIANNTYKYYGKYNNEDLRFLMFKINESYEEYIGKENPFIFGYFIKEDSGNTVNEYIPEILKDANIRPSKNFIPPTNNPGLLQIYSSMDYRSPTSDWDDNNSHNLKNSHIKKSLSVTYVFHDFITGDLYVSKL